MDAMHILALTLGVAWASGLNLYAAVLVLGLMGATGHVSLPADLEVLSHPMVIAAAGQTASQSLQAMHRSSPFG